MDAFFNWARVFVAVSPFQGFAILFVGDFETQIDKERVKYCIQFGRISGYARSFRTLPVGGWHTGLCMRLDVIVRVFWFPRVSVAFFDFPGSWHVVHCRRMGLCPPLPNDASGRLVNWTLCIACSSTFLARNPDCFVLLG